MTPKVFYLTEQERDVVARALAYWIAKSEPLRIGGYESEEMMKALLNSLAAGKNGCDYCGVARWACPADCPQETRKTS